jgi:hypothetical protein
VKIRQANFLTSSLDLNYRVEVKFHLAREGRSHADKYVKYRSQPDLLTIEHDWIELLGA